MPKWGSCLILKRISRALALGLCAIVLGSCSLIQPVTEMMRPPKLSKEQLEVDAALKAALGTKSISLKYPRSGNYRSAFVFYDIDADSVEEAIVFYQPGVEGSGVRINILDYHDGGWTSVYDVPGEGSGDVDYITFENIESSEYKNIVIGWQPQNSKDKTLTVYRYESNKLKSVFSEKYTHSVIRDFNGNGLMDVMLISLRRYSVMFATNVSGTIATTDEVALSRDIKSVEQLLCGRLSDSRQAMFLDVALDGADYATEIITVSDNLLSPLINISAVYTGDGSDVTEEQAENFLMTQRADRVLSADIDANGLIEVPSSTVMLGYDDVQEDARRYTTTYSVLKDGVMTPIETACVNVESGYMIKMPPSWVENVTVVSESDMSWRFIKYNDNLNDHSLELLRINKVLKNDYKDKFATDSLELAQKGLYVFYGYIPPTSESELRITNLQLEEMFLLI